MDMLCPASRFKPGDRILQPYGWTPPISSVVVGTSVVSVHWDNGEMVMYRRPAGEFVRRDDGG